MEKLMDSKKKFRVTRMRVCEVSLAANPKNQFPFLVIKDKGGYMDKFIKLIAALAAKSSDIPEALKEDLKKVDTTSLNEADVIEALKEIGITIEANNIPDDSIVVKKDEVVDRTKFDVVEKDSWIPKPKDMFANLPQEIKDRLLANEADIAAFKKDKLNTALSKTMGEEIAKDVLDVALKMEEKDLSIFTKIISGLQQVIKDLGGPIGKKLLDDDGDVTRSVFDKEVAAIAKEMNIDEVAASVEWAKRNPERASKLK